MTSPTREPRTVIADTTPIISLALIDQLDNLRRLYSEILVPPAVEQEILAGGGRLIGAEGFQAAPWFQTRPLSDPSRSKLLAGLDPGEAEVLSLAQEVGADLLLLDERLARRYAAMLGFSFTGTVGVLLKSKERGLVSQVGPLLNDLVQRGIHLSDAVVQEALKLAGED